MNKKSLITAMAFSSMISVGDGQANEIDQISQMMRILEIKFGQKLIAVVNEDYKTLSKKVVGIEENSPACKKSPAFEHWIDGDKTKTVFYNCEGEKKGKHIISQSISKGQKLPDGSVCKDVTFYYLSVVEGVLFRAQAAGIENKKNKSVYSDIICDEIN